MTEPTKEQVDAMTDRMSKGMTTTEDADLMRNWICMLWEAQRKRMFGETKPTIKEKHDERQD